METRFISAFKPTRLARLIRLTMATSRNDQGESASLRSNLSLINPVLKKYAAASLLSLTALTAYATYYGQFNNSQFLMLYDGYSIGEYNNVTGYFFFL